MKRVQSYFINSLIFLVNKKCIVTSQLRTDAYLCGKIKKIKKNVDQICTRINENCMFEKLIWKWDFDPRNVTEKELR